MEPALGPGAEGSICSKRLWSPTLTRPKDLRRGSPKGILAAAFRERKRTYNLTGGA